jgi:tetratricopeptide (TPR) repeat protein
MRIRLFLLATLFGVGSGVVRTAAQAGTAGQLDREIARARALVEANPASEDAHLGLATLENMKADLSNDRDARRSAADHFIKAAELALEDRQVRHTFEVSRALVALNDTARLDEVFSRILDVAPGDYLALVDYADGLARLGRREADARFEEAIQLHPVNNGEAIGRYAQHLLERGDAEKALTVLEQMTPEMRQMNGSPVFLYKRILERLGRDTSFADAEIERMRQRLGTPVQGGVPGPELTGGPATPQRPKP